MVASSSSSVPPPVSMTTGGSATTTVALASTATGGPISISDGTGTGTGSPCAACKFLRRKCQPDCVFAPYFPPDNPDKFVNVHRVFGASNVTKILKELPPHQRDDAVSSLSYEADMRHRDPVYGCVGVISILQHRLRQLQMELGRASYDLLKYHQAAEAAQTAAATSMVVQGSNGGMAGITDFVSNPGPSNSMQNFININHSMAAAAIGGAEFVHEDHFASDQMLSRSYSEEATTTRVGSNGGGGYGFGNSSAMGSGHNVVCGLGQIADGQFFKPIMSAEDNEQQTDGH